MLFFKSNAGILTHPFGLILFFSIISFLLISYLIYNRKFKYLNISVGIILIFSIYYIFFYFSNFVLPSWWIQKIDLLKYSGHSRIFNTSIEMWKLQPIFGFGHKSFKIKCWKILFDDLEKIGERFDPNRPQNVACGNHPHNYYLELLAETGIIGITLLITFFLFIVKNSLSYLVKNKEKINFVLPIFIIFFIEIWPLKSSGSFFTVWGATFFWINTAILMSYTVKKST